MMSCKSLIYIHYSVAATFSLSQTHTMTGNANDPGVQVLTLKNLFAQIDAIQARQEYTYKVSVCLLEVYNEHIRDLLSPNLNLSHSNHGRHDSMASLNSQVTSNLGSNNGNSNVPNSANSNGPPQIAINPNSLDLREDPIKGMVVAGITEVSIKDVSEILSLLDKGNRNRTTEPTKANEVSSRSHAVLQLIVERHAVSSDIHGVIKVGKLNLNDLAGSERASKTENRGVRLVEGGNINRSLLALANCINALVTAQKAGGNPNDTSFIPYRDSKLTRLLSVGEQERCM